MTVLACETSPEVTINVTYPAEPSDGLMVIEPTCAEGEGGIWWNQLVLPAFAMRYTTTPPSAWVAGEQTLGAVPDASTLPFTIACRASDTAGLETLRAYVADVVGRWGLTVAVKVAVPDDDPVTIGEWAARPTLPIWFNPVTPQRAGMFVAEAQIILPVNPTAAP